MPLFVWVFIYIVERIANFRLHVRHALVTTGRWLGIFSSNLKPPPQNTGHEDLRKKANTKDNLEVESIILASRETVAVDGVEHDLAHTCNLPVPGVVSCASARAMPVMLSAPTQLYLLCMPRVNHAARTVLECSSAPSPGRTRLSKSTHPGCTSDIASNLLTIYRNRCIPILRRYMCPTSFASSVYVICSGSCQ